MIRIRDIKIGAKLAIAFGLILLLMALAGIITMFSMQSIKVSIDHTSQIWLPRAVTISELSLYTNDLRRQQIQLTVTEQIDLRNEIKEQIGATLDRINASRDRYVGLRDSAETLGIYSARERELFDTFDSQWETYQDLTIQWILLMREDEQLAMSEILSVDARNRAGEFREILRELVHISSEESQQAAVDAELAYNRTHRLTRVLMFLAAGLSLVFIIVLIRFVSRPLKELADASCRVAAGDLDVRIDSTGKDEIGQLADSFNQMTESLRNSKAKTVEHEAALREQNTTLQATLVKLKETQQQLLLREKMASLGNLVAGVAHEINNPVGAVSSSSDNSRRALEKLDALLKDERWTQLAEDPMFTRLICALQESTRITAMAGDRIANIVKSLKNFARLDEADYQQADIHQGIDSTLTLLHHELKNRIEVVKDYGKLPWVKCYPNQLNQVFMNLLINAAQAIIGEGTITIKTSANHDTATISISDTGRGISSKNIERVFDPGFTTKGVGVGTGLGLSISYNIIKKHDGEITLESESGKGTTFTVTIPIDPGDSDDKD